MSCTQRELTLVEQPSDTNGLVGFASSTNRETRSYDAQVQIGLPGQTEAHGVM
jgi:hypothetical protein